MLEAAGRAIFKRQLSNSSVGLKWEHLTERGRQGYIDDARVALEAAEAATSCGPPLTPSLEG
jgi:hypothetical protein